MKSIKWDIANLDFAGAFERWSTTSPAWKNRWYDACEKIFVTGKKWLNEYILNPVSKTISKINDIRSVFTRVKRSGISISEDCQPWDDSAGVQKCYLIVFGKNLLLKPMQGWVLYIALSTGFMNVETCLRKAWSQCLEQNISKCILTVFIKMIGLSMSILI